MERRHIKAALRICGFETRECRDFIVETEFGTWRSFSSVDSNFFAALGDRLEFAGFNITATQTLNLSVLKVWVEDKYRMKEHKDATVFRQEKDKYLLLYQTFLTA